MANNQMTNDKMANFWIFVPARKSAPAQKNELDNL
jgi:hypothetical protein